MKIIAKLEPSNLRRTEVFELSDFGLTENEWDKLSLKERESLIKEQIDAIHEQPYWVLDDYFENHTQNPTP